MPDAGASRKRQIPGCLIRCVQRVADFWWRLLTGSENLARRMVLRACHKCAPDEATQVSGILSTAICAVVFRIWSHRQSNSQDADVGQCGSTAAQDPIEGQRVRRRYPVVLAAN